MKVSVTGADGFLGSYLTDYLLQRNIQVKKLTRTSGFDLRFLNRNKKNNNNVRIYSRMVERFFIIK